MYQKENLKNIDLKMYLQKIVIWHC